MTMREFEFETYFSTISHRPGSNVDRRPVQGTSNVDANVDTNVDENVDANATQMRSKCNADATLMKGEFGF